MKKIYDWDAKPCERNHTVADLKARKGKNIGVLSQTTANTEEEAKAASEAGTDLLMCDAKNTEVTRENAPTLFLTAALALPDYSTQNDVLRGHESRRRLHLHRKGAPYRGTSGLRGHPEDVPSWNSAT